MKVLPLEGRWHGQPAKPGFPAAASKTSAETVALLSLRERTRDAKASVRLSGGQMERRDDIWPAVKVDSRHAGALTSQ